MANILIVVYLLIVLSMIVVILLQRSEGGALGMGGGNSGGFAPIRTTANLLTRTTAILGALFMATAIGLSVVNDAERSTSSILDSATQNQQEGAEGGDVTILDALNSLSGEDSLATPEVPSNDTPEVTPNNPVDADAPNLPLPTNTPAAPTGN